MRGPNSTDWLSGLGATFEAGVAREEEIAADDLAFSLRQGGDLRTTLGSGGWALVLRGESSWVVDEVGSDYVLAGRALVPSDRAVLRSSDCGTPQTCERTFTELLNEVCRLGSRVEVNADGASFEGQVVRVAGDHLVLRTGVETVLGLRALELIRLPAGYSPSRGLSG